MKRVLRSVVGVGSLRWFRVGVGGVEGFGWPGEEWRLVPGLDAVLVCGLG